LQRGGSRGNECGFQGRYERAHYPQCDFIALLELEALLSNFKLKPENEKVIDGLEDG